MDEDRIIKGMVGRDMAHRYPPRGDVAIGEPLLEVEGWTVRHPIHAQRIVVEDISLTVRRGAVVGIAGLLGDGRTAFAMSLFGRSYGQGISGRARSTGRPVPLPLVPRAL